ncbi:MAG: site-specific DNA-methyltransferase [Synergistaceae bacterium]
MKEIKDIYDNIYHGKWEDLIDTIPSNSIDLIVTSPPYNVNLGSNKHKKDKYDSYDDNMPYNEYLDWIEGLFIHCNRILKTGGRLCVNIGDGANGQIPTHVDFTYRLLHLSDKVSDLKNDPYKMMTTIVWDKNQIGASTAWGSWKSPSCPSFPTQFEFIIVVAKGMTKHEGDNDKITVTGDNFIRNSRALWQFTPETSMMKNYNHPAMFPTELPRRLIDQLTYKNDVIFDPFSGAGTTCAVAKQMGRHYIGFEMSEQYYNVSMERLSLIPELDGNLPKWMK